MTEKIVTLEYKEVPVEIINTFVFPIISTKWIFHALRSLEMVTPQNYKTIVVNQTQPDPEFEQQLWDEVDLVIHPKKNYGFATASNWGLRLATTKYVTVCNDDVIFLHNWWQGIEDTFAKFETAIGVAPRSLQEPGWGYGEAKSRIYLDLLEAWKYPHKVQELVEKNNGAVIDGIVMFCVTFKREEFTELGLFDERFFPGSGEDYDACARSAQAGYRMMATSLSWIWHFWGKSKEVWNTSDVALPPAREYWNKISTKGFGDEGLWHPDVDCWGKGCTRTDPNIWRAPL